MRKRNKKILLALLTASFVIFSFSITANVAFAADNYEEYPGGFKILPDCYKDGICDLDDFVQLFINLAHVGLKVLPYLAMIFMIWAGFNLIMAGGNPEKIQGGKKMLTSIILGVLIVTILAWVWSLFVVVVLTGSLEGKIFTGYGSPLEREWWGGGAVGDLPPEAGCCVVNGYGCIEVTREDCANYPAIWLRAGVTPPETNFMGEQQYCYDYVATCSKWDYGCCVPTDVENTTCYTPGKNGCLEWPFTEHTPNNCANIKDRCENIEIGDAPPDGSTTGCCVEQDSCNTKGYSECAGSFYAEQSCDSVDGCSGGCCVGVHGCTSGKLGCDGTWNAEACDEGDNDPDNSVGAQNCLMGCCIAPWSAVGLTCHTNYTLDACYSIFGGDIGFNSTFPDCTGNPECTNGCCTETCVEGNIDGACPNALSNYDKNNGCGPANNCDVGCCLQNGANRCVENIFQKDCADPGDQFIGAGACPAGADAQCEEGCCSDPTQEYRCIDGYSRQRCSTNGGTFSATCAGLGNICNTGGSCTTVVPAECVNLSSSQTRAYCTNVLGGTYSPAACP